MRLRTAYVSGPMRGLPEFNYPAFHRASARLRAASWAVISPAEMDQGAGLCGDDSPEKPGTPGCVRLYADRDIRAIMSLRAEEGDAIAMLPGWEYSEGAVAELAFALWVKLSVIDAVTMEPLDIRLAKEKVAGWERSVLEEVA